MDLIEKKILKHKDFFNKSIDIKITSLDIIDKINAFDWFDLQEAKTPESYTKIVTSIFNRFKWKYHKQFHVIVFERFCFLFVEAIEQIKESIEAISKSYNIEGGGGGFRNELVDKYYYIEYWANKKNIPVNYNEKDYNQRKLFNFDTILLSILSDKLSTFNEWERNKSKK